MSAKKETRPPDPEVTPKLIKKPKLSEKEIIERSVIDPISTIRSIVLKDLYYFIQYFWSVYSQEKFVPNWHIEKICRELEEVARRVGNKERKKYDLIINVPPGTTKTATISIFFPLWCWANWYWMRFITASYTQPLSLESAEYSRDIVRSDRWRVIFPEIDIKEDKDTKSNFRVVKYLWINKGNAPRIEHGGNRFSTSVTGTVTGFHGHINIVDDPIDPNGATSTTELQKVNHWMTTTLPSRKVDKKVTVNILVMQRLHQDDPTGHLLKNQKAKIRHICLPGEVRNYADKVSPPEWIEFYKDGLLDPVRLDNEALADFLINGQYTYGSQIGQDPIPLGGGMFKTDNIAKITHPPDRSEIVAMVRYWDKAGTKGGTGAFTAGVKIARLKDKSFVILDVKRGRWSSEERERIIKACAQADGVYCKIGVEQEPGSGGKESAEATLKNIAGFTGFKDRPTGDKTYRADPYSVQVNLGNVTMLTADWNEEYIEELKNFPNSTFKDQTDASSGAFAKLTSMKTVGVRKR